MTLRAVDATKQSAADNNLVGGAVADPVALKAFFDDMALKINQIGTDNGDMATAITSAKTTVGAINELRNLLGGKRLQSGSFTVSNLTANGIITAPVANFPVPYTSTPVVLLTIQNLATGARTTVWIPNTPGLSSFTAQVQSDQAQVSVIIGWISIGI